ncbi:MAG: tetratricopeptide repeat protein [Acidobacteria bacterium]|nr:tetratricopeptide repeat protein [Acidobacteriota bacterium]
MHRKNKLFMMRPNRSMGLTTMTRGPANSEWFSRRQVLRIVGIRERQLAAWERQGWVQPLPTVPVEEVRNAPAPVEASHQPFDPSEGRFYSFTDIVTLKTLLKLRKNRIPVGHIRLALSSLRAKLAEVDNPLAQLPIQVQGRRLGVYFQGSYMEPTTGQLQLDFSFEGRKGTVYRLPKMRQAARLSEAAARLSAEEFFRLGLHYEEHPEMWAEAVRAYQKAVALNPKAVGALINLGTLYYNQGQLEQAELFFRSDLSVDPAYGLIHFNLGNVFDGRNELDKARHGYEEAIRLDPDFADAHYNLALVYEKLGLHGQARQQWRLYVKLDPHSLWAARAREQLQKTPLRIVARGKAQAPNRKKRGGF